MTAFFDIETTGLNPFRSQLVTIQARRNGEQTVWKAWETPEPIMIAKFLVYLDTLPSSELIVGFNIMGFDLPFVAARASACHSWNEETHVRLYRRNWLDLYQYLGAGYRSVDFWLGRLGVARECSFTGKDVPGLYGKGEYGKIERHAVEDLALCETLYNSLWKLRGKED